MSRRALLGRAAAAGALFALGDLPGIAEAGTTCQPDPFRASLSVSPFTELVLQQTSLTDGVRIARTAADLQRTYVQHGATEVYARIATLKEVFAANAPVGWAFGLDRARLARDLGLPFNPELGLFGSYGDGATYQAPPDFSDYPSIRVPGPWTSLTLEQMLPPMRQYGALVAQQIVATGARVEVWDLGNEVENGISGVCVYPLFPTTDYRPPNAVDPAIGTMSVETLVAMPEDDRIAWSRAHLWPYVGKILAAAAEGVRSVVPNARFSTHISHFGHRTPAVQVAFWETVRSVGYLPDVLGTSYYPTDGKTTFGPADMFGFLKDTAAQLHSRFQRQLFIAEYGYPSGQMPPPYPFNDPVPGYPQTTAGQHDFTRDLVAWGRSSGLLAGLRPWAPDFCTNSAWQPMSWFTPVPGKPAAPKPALGAEAEGSPPAAACVPALRVDAHDRGRRLGRRRLLVELSAPAGPLRRLTLELLRGRSILGTVAVAALGGTPRDLVIPLRSGRVAPGGATLVVRQGRDVLIRRHVHLG